VEEARRAKNKHPLGFGPMMAFAGLWDAWKDPADGRCLQSYTIIITDANEIMMPIRNRMPVILHEGNFKPLTRTWRSPPAACLSPKPFSADEMKALKVSKDVGTCATTSLTH
jgi:putative SOS response-associated peptidase YedK